MPKNSAGEKQKLSAAGKLARNAASREDTCGDWHDFLQRFNK